MSIVSKSGILKSTFMEMIHWWTTKVQGMC